MPNIPSKISERSVHNFLSYLSDSQTNKQTKAGRNITSLAEVKKNSHLADRSTTAGAAADKAVSNKEAK